MTYKKSNVGSIGPLPESNPTLALAKSLMADSAGAEKVKTIAELNEMAMEQRHAEAYAKIEKERTLNAIHEAKQGMQALALDQAMTLWEQNALGEQLGRELDREVRKSKAVEQDVRRAMGLRSPQNDSGYDNPDNEETPMTSGKTSAARELHMRRRMLQKISQDVPQLRNAGLVGYQQNADAPFLEYYMEETAPGVKDRLQRAAVLGGVGGLLGGGAGVAAQRAAAALAPRMTSPALQNFALKMRGAGRKPGLLGAGLGLLGGGLLGGMSNRSVNTIYDTGTGEALGYFAGRAPQNVFAQLSPGQQPGNFAVATREHFEDPETAPEIAYGVDLDEAVAEDPLLAASLLNNSGGQGKTSFIRRNPTFRQSLRDLTNRYSYDQKKLYSPGMLNRFAKRTALGIGAGGLVGAGIGAPSGEGLEGAAMGMTFGGAYGAGAPFIVPNAVGSTAMLGGMAAGLVPAVPTAFLSEYLKYGPF